MRGCDDDIQLTMMPTTSVNYSDDEILQDSSTLLADDVVCAAAAPRRKSADYACCDRRACFAPYSGLDVEHHPLNGHQHVDDDERQIDWRRTTQRSYDDHPRDASTHIDVGPRTTTHDCERTDAAAWSRDSVHRGDDDVTWWRGDTAAVNYRLRFIDEHHQPAHDERPGLSSMTASRLQSTPRVRSVSDQSEFVVRRRDTGLSSTTSSSSSSSPAAAQSSPTVTDVVPPASQRLPPTSLRARKRGETTQRSAAAGGRLRRSNSVAGSSTGRSQQSGDEGFADSRMRTPEPRRMSASVQSERCCVCRREPDSHLTTASQSNVSTMSTMSDQARKRSYRVGLNLFNKYVVSPDVQLCSQLAQFQCANLSYASLC